MRQLQQASPTKTISGKTLTKIELFRQPAGDTSTDAFTVDFANVQLERGPVATPFEHRSAGDELIRCQRYYQQYVNLFISNVFTEHYFFISLLIMHESYQLVNHGFTH